LQDINSVLSLREKDIENLKQLATTLNSSYSDADKIKVNEIMLTTKSLYTDVKSRLMRLLEDSCIKESQGMIRVTIHAARNLQRNNKFVKADPYVIVRHGEQTHRTPTVKGSQSPIWQDDVKFSLNSPTVKAEVYDEDFGDDEPMGSASIDVSNVSTTNAIRENWIPLKNCGTGELLISVEMSANDEHIPTARSTPERIVSTVGKIKRFITIHKARNLKRNSKFVKADPYVIVRHELQKVKSNTIKNTQNPEWNFAVSFTIDPLKDILVEVYDEDFGDDEPMGIATINLSTFQDQNEIKAQWFPIKLKNKVAGEVFLSLEEKMSNNTVCESSDSLIKGQLHLTIRKARNLKRNNMFVKTDPYVLITYGPQRYQSHTVKSSQNPEWEYDIKIPITEHKPINIQVLDEDFGDDEPMGNAIMTIDDLCLTEDSQEKWIPISLNNSESGELLISSQFLTKKKDFSQQLIHNENSQGNARKILGGHLRLTIHRARNLARNNKFVKSDPYVVIKYQNSKRQSKVTKSTQNPEWQYDVDFELNEESKEMISIEIYDQDYGPDEPMGITSIDLSTISRTTPMQEKWIPLQNCSSGDVLISAAYISEPEPYMQTDQESQVSTLRFEQDRSSQTDTISPPIPDSGVFMSTSLVSQGTDSLYGVGTPDDLIPEIDRDEIDEIQSLPDLDNKSKDQLIHDLDTSILNCKKHIENLELTLDISEDQDHLLCELTKCKTSMELCQHFSLVLRTRHGMSGSTIRESSISELKKMILNLEEKIKEKGQESLGASSRTYSDALKSGAGNEKSGSVSPGSTCPLCRRRNWKQLEGDLWRLERWLEHAGGSLAQLLRNGVPGSIEQLEEVIQDHREFLLDLDSHKSVAMSINVVGCHLAEHTPTQTKAEAMRTRLAAVNEKWDHVCEQATLWQTRLQTALLENGEFHQTIQELLQWLEATTATIKEAEPVDLSVSKSVLQTKYNKFLELQKDLQRCEPRVVSLQEAADQLELQADSPACKQVKKKLAVLSRSLRGLIQVCGIYLTSLARTLGLPPPPQVSDSLYDSALNIHDTVLPPLTEQLMAVESPEQAKAAPNPRSTEQSDDELNTGVLSRSYRFLGRVVRAAVPIQALMLLLLGVSSIVPLDQDELICSLQNNLQRSLEPMLQWSNGPPPI